MNEREQPDKPASHDSPSMPKESIWADLPDFFTQPMFAGAILLICLFFAYAPALHGEFIWDDLLLIKRNPLVTGKLSLATIWFHTDFPLSIVALWAQWLVFGAQPSGYHVVNILIHGTACLMLWQVLRALQVPGAGFATWLFALHPVCAGTVAWVSEQKNTLSFLLFLVSGWLYMRAGRRQAASEAPPAALFRHWLYWCALGAFGLALLAKTSTAMLPVFLVLCIWFTRRTNNLKVLIPTVPFFLFSLVFGIMTIWFQMHQAMADKAVRSVAFWQRLLDALSALGFYLSKALFPANLSMIYPPLHGNSVWLLAFPAVLGLAAILARTGSNLPVARFLLFGVIYFVLSLLPVLGLIDMYYFALSLVSDHLQYIALPGICIIVALLIHSVISRLGLVSCFGFRASSLFVPVTLIGLLALGVLTHQRCQILARDESVWRDTLAKNPGAWLAHNNLGCILAERQDFNGAEREFGAALQLHPKNAQALCNYAKLLALKGDLSGAELHYRAALHENSHDAEILKSFAGMLQRGGKSSEASSYLAKAVELEPSPDNRLELANALQIAGSTREAIEQYRLVLRRQPESIQALNNLGWILATSGDVRIRSGREAIDYAQRAVKVTREEDPVTLGTLATAYAESGEFKEAVRTMEKAVDLAEKKGQPQVANMARQLMELFRSGKAYHMPPARSPQKSVENTR